MKVRSVMQLAAVAALFVGSTAQAQLATFDDLAACTRSNNGSLIANGYQGFNWSNFYVADGPNTATAFGGPGYGTGTVTQRCISFNGFGEQSEVSSASDFIFNGGYFTAAFANSLGVAIRAFDASNMQIFTRTLSLNTAGPQLLDVNWGGVRRVTFSAGNNQPGSQFAFDNFRFNNTPDPSIVPEPSTYALLGTGLIALAAVSRRRRV